MTDNVLDLGDILVLETVAEVPDSMMVPAVDRWPCPACGERRSVTTSMQARVRNRVGDPMERWIRLCATCVDAASAPATRHVRHTGSPGGEPGSGQPRRGTASP